MLSLTPTDTHSSYVIRKHPYSHTLLLLQAITYYEHSIKGGGPSSLKYDLAKLLLKLRSYDKCEKILNIAIEIDKDSNEFERIQERTKYLLLLANVRYIIICNL